MEERGWRAIVHEVAKAGHDWMTKPLPPSIQQFMISGNNITKEIAGYEHEQNLFIGKDPDAGKDWRQEEGGDRGCGG